MDIVQFINDRLDEDEAAARTADVKQGDPEWYATHHIGGHTVRSKRDNRPTARVADLAGDDDADLTGILDGRAVSEHIARHDPARVLREVEAKRSIVEWERRYRTVVEKRGEDWQRRATAPLRALAAIYADHPDYDPEWW